MPKICTYRCSEAGHEFEHWHNSAEEPPPDFCPICVQETKLSQVPGGMHVGGSARGKAERMAFEIARDQYGMTDMKDSTREGESIVKPPPAPQGDARALQEHIAQTQRQMKTPLSPGQQEMAKGFWGGQNGNSNPAAAQSMMSMARQATSESKAGSGHSAMHTFHEAMRKNPQDQVKWRIVGK